MYIKSKFKLLVRKDTTVCLLGEIHRKPFFDYLGCNVGLSDISIEAATSVFAFMFSSVLS